MNFGELTDVEIFEAGSYHQGRYAYTEADLDQMVANWRAMGDRLRPTLVIGHDEDQDLLKNSGLFAAGWLTGLRRHGKKLLADFKDVPRVIVDLIRRGAYRRVSAEVYHDFRQGGASRGHVLRRVALLGGEIPEIKTLQDVAALYEEAAYPEGRTQWVALGSKEESTMNQNLSPSDPAPPVPMAEQVAALNQAKAEAEARVRRLEGELAERSRTEHDRDLASFAETLTSGQGRVGLAPSLVREVIVPVLTGLDHQTPVKFGRDEMTPYEAVKGLIDGLIQAHARRAAFVVFGELAPARPQTPEPLGDDPRKAVAEAARRHAAQFKVTFAEALRAVLAADPELARAYQHYTPTGRD
jgi:hypothetical protein